MSFSDSNSTGVKLTVNGTNPDTQVNVSFTSLTGPSQGEGRVFLSEGNVAKYYDIQVSGNANPEIGVSVCFSDPSFSTSSQMAYWDGVSWILLPSTVTGNTICADVSVSDLKGTNFVVGSGFVAAPVTTPDSGQAALKTGQGHDWAIPDLIFLLSVLSLVTFMTMVAYLSRRSSTRVRSQT